MTRRIGLLRIYLMKRQVVPIGAALALAIIGCAPMHANLARSALQEQRLNEAVNEVQLALAQHPADPGLEHLAAAIYTNRGARFYTQGNMTRAATDLHTALNFDPGYSAAYNYLGLVAFSQQNWKDAIVYGERAASLENCPPASWVGVARVKMRASAGDRAPDNAAVNR
ncbi:MAG: tetratricopeptide repeat protein [Candidatus Binataceae bacterium]|nr:tetratricopeptide repeat protein [Candidatus Binataceae bacterium]